MARSWIFIGMTTKETSGAKFTSHRISIMVGTRDGRWMAGKLSVKGLLGKQFTICAWMSLVVNPKVVQRLESTKEMGRQTKGGVFKEGFESRCPYYINATKIWKIQIGFVLFI